MWSSNFLHAGLSGKILHVGFYNVILSPTSYPCRLVISDQRYHYTVTHSVQLGIYYLYNYYGQRISFHAVSVVFIFLFSMIL